MKVPSAARYESPCRAEISHRWPLLKKCLAREVVQMWSFARLLESFCRDEASHRAFFVRPYLYVRLGLVVLLRLGLSAFVPKIGNDLHSVNPKLSTPPDTKHQ